MGYGTITKLNDRGFGFIEQGTGEDLFFHKSALEGIDFDALHVGERVEFDAEGDPRGRGDRATRVRRIDARPG